MRLLVRYTIPKYNESGIVGVDLPTFDYMTAATIATSINHKIRDQYNNVDSNEIKIDVIEYLGPQQKEKLVSTPSPSPLNISKKCLACGGEHGNSGLPCPTMTPMAKLL